jgi:tetratricopeptide (TPR) repeat protein
METSYNSNDEFPLSVGAAYDNDDDMGEDNEDQNETTSGPFGSSVGALFGSMNKRKKLKKSKLKEKTIISLDALGEAYLEYINGNIEHALELLLGLQASSPHLPDSYLACSLIYEEMGNIAKSLECLHRSVKKIKNNVDVNIKIMNFEYLLGHYDISYKYCIKVLKSKRTLEVFCKKVILMIRLQPPQANTLKSKLNRTIYYNLKDIMKQYPNSLDFLIIFASECLQTDRFDLVARAVYQFIAVVVTSSAGAAAVSTEAVAVAGQFFPPARAAVPLRVLEKYDILEPYVAQCHLPEEYYAPPSQPPPPSSSPADDDEAEAEEAAAAAAAAAALSVDHLVLRGCHMLLRLNFTARTDEYTQSKR